MCCTCRILWEAYDSAAPRGLTTPAAADAEVDGQLQGGSDSSSRPEPRDAVLRALKALVQVTQAELVPTASATAVHQL